MPSRAKRYMSGAGNASLASKRLILSSGVRGWRGGLATSGEWVCLKLVMRWGLGQEEIFPAGMSGWCSGVGGDGGCSIIAGCCLSATGLWELSCLLSRKRRLKEVIDWRRDSAPGMFGVGNKRACRLKLLVGGVDMCLSDVKCRHAWGRSWSRLSEEIGSNYIPCSLGLCFHELECDLNVLQ